MTAHKPNSTNPNWELRSLAILLLALAAIFYFLAAQTLWAANRPPSVIHNVQFLRQVPMGEWNDPRQVDGCEETSILMALAWARGGQIPEEEARRDIINMSEYQKVVYGFFQDTSIQDTAKLMSEYYRHENLRVQENISSENIKDVIAAGHVAIIPLNTRLTGLPIYRSGPTRHTVIAVGYDDQRNSVIVHDPFYAGGKYLSIPSKALDKALWNYRSGVHLPHGPKHTAMLVIGK